MSTVQELVDALADRGVRSGPVGDHLAVIALGRTKQTTVWLPEGDDGLSPRGEYVWLVDGIRNESPAGWTAGAIARTAQAIAWSLK
jgi:hypothetical protein